MLLFNRDKSSHLETYKIFLRDELNEKCTLQKNKY